MSGQDDNSALSRVSISTGVIPFPSMDSSLLPQALSALEESSDPSPGKLTFKKWYKFDHWRKRGVHVNSTDSYFV